MHAGQYKHLGLQRFAGAYVRGFVSGGPYPRGPGGGVKFHVGFDRSSLKGSLVFGVEPGSEAYKAGLGDGQRILGSSFYIGDTSKEVQLAIWTDPGNQVLKYFSRGSEASLQQFSLDPNEIFIQ